jgi:hypothetical protein
MIWTGHILNCLWPIAVDLDRLPATAQSATEIRLVRVIIFGPNFDLNDSDKWLVGESTIPSTQERHKDDQIRNHPPILPRFGRLPLDAIDETAVQEVLADVQRATFERRKKNGQLLKT